MNVKRSSAFTLVELLVVIGIIALLISILLPSLGKARKSAASIKCAANLHSITLGMIIYASQNHNYILGSPNTTGSPANNYQGAAFTDGSSPGMNQIWDWESPIMDTLGLKVFYSPTADTARANGQAKWDRVNFQLHYPMFICPSNNAVCSLYNSGTAFPGVTLPTVVPWASYSTSMMFLVTNNPASGSTTSMTTQGNVYDNPPPGYGPKVTEVGNATKKIFIADGARYLNLATNAFDMDFAYSGTTGGEYSDYGAYDAFSNARSRQGSPGNGGTGGDERVLWARHGAGIPHGSSDSFRFNAGFFDGHVETLGDLQGANPTYWAPKGTVIANSDIWADVHRTYHIVGNFTVPE